MNPRFATVQKISLKLIGGSGDDRDTRPVGAIFFIFMLFLEGIAQNNRLLPLGLRPLIGKSG